MVPPIIVPKTIVYGTSLVSIQVEKNTIQIQFQNSLPKISVPNILGVTIHRHQLKKLIVSQNERNEPNSHE